MKLLFISDFILAETQGAKYLSQAHYYSLKSIFGQENVDIVALNSSFGCDDIHYLYIEKKVAKICKFTNILMGMPFLLRRKGYKKILSLLKEKHYDYIFVDHSIYGVLIKKIKTKFKVPVFTFFHGIIKYQNSEYKKNNKTSIFFPLIQYNINKNEKLSVKYSDKCILLNVKC